MTAPDSETTPRTFEWWWRNNPVHQSPYDSAYSVARTAFEAGRSDGRREGMTQLLPAVKFAAAVFQEHRDELADVDGGWLQEKMAECGLLKEFTATEPCREGCRCAEWDSFPQPCMRNTDATDAMLAEAKRDE